MGPQLPLLRQPPHEGIWLPRGAEVACHMMVQPLQGTTYRTSSHDRVLLVGCYHSCQCGAKQRWKRAAASHVRRGNLGQQCC